MKFIDLNTRNGLDKKPIERLALSDFIDFNQLKQILESIQNTIGLGIELYDFHSDEHLEIGTLSVCKRFHRCSPNSCQRCYYKDSKYLDDIELDGPAEFTCKYGLRDIVFPVKVNNQLIALLFYGQFLYSDQTIDEVFFQNQAKEYDFNEETYLHELKNIPVLTKQQVKDITKLFSNLIDFISDKADRRLFSNKQQLLDQIADQQREIEEVFESLSASEEKYQSIVSAMSEGVVIQASDGEIITCNESAEKILGLTREQMMGCTSLDPRWHAIHEDGTPFPGDTHPAMVTLKNGKSLRNIVMGVHKPDGNLSWIRINTEPIFHKDESKPFAVVASFTDFTEQKRRELEMQQEQEFKNRLFGVIAHDLSAPIGSINEMINIIISAIEKNRFDDAKKFLRALKKSSNKTYNLIKELLEWAKIQFNHVDVKKENVRIDKLVDDVIKYHSNTLENKEIKLKLAIEPFLSIYSDKDILQIVIRNILSNAIKYSPTYGKVQISAHKKDGKINIAIKDSGIGMTEDEIKSLFSNGPSISKPGTKNERGFGMGIFICRELITLCNGEIGVKSKKGTGTTFSVILK